MADQFRVVKTLDFDLPALSQKIGEAPKLSAEEQADYVKELWAKSEGKWESRYIC